MLPDIPEGEKFPPRVVENAVYYNPDTVFMALRDKFRKCRIASQTAVNETVIPGVIAVGGGLEYRTYVDCGKIHLL